MYDIEDEKESGKCDSGKCDSGKCDSGKCDSGKCDSGKCRGRLQNCGTTGEASSAAQPLVEVGQNDIEIMVHRNRGLWVRAAQLPELFCSWDLAYRCTKSGWLKPVVQGKRRTIYRMSDVLSCMRRIEAGELPLARRSKTAH